MSIQNTGISSDSVGLAGAANVVHHEAVVGEILCTFLRPKVKTNSNIRMSLDCFGDVYLSGSGSEFM